MPVFGTILTRAGVQAVLREQGVTCYWRTRTPLVTRWAMVWQRLVGHATLDDAVSALQDGAADGLDPADQHAEPLSVRLGAVSTSAYAQARQRLPTAVVRALRERVTAAVHEQVGLAEQTWPSRPGRADLARARAAPAGWDDLPAASRGRPRGDLEGTYGRASGRYGPRHGVTAQAVMTFCARTLLVAQHAASPPGPSETSLVRAVLAPEPAGTLVGGEMAFGI